jgi:glutamine synthetase
LLLCDHKKIITWIDKCNNSLSSNRVYILVGSEIEFYLRQSDQVPSQEKIDIFSSYISECHANLILEKEKGKGQYEIPLPYTLPKDALPLISDVRSLIKASAKKAGMEAIFDPKPFPNDYGSALHLHISMHSADGNNLFTDNQMLMESIIFSILDLIESDLDFICDEQDLDRLKEGWMAPSRICWGGNNRTTAIRIPADKPEHKRFEFRLPSANSDQYRIFLFILIGILRLKQVNKKHDKIYGNAYDEQYSLQPLRFCNNMEKKNFIDIDKIDVLVENLCRSAGFKL